MDNEEKIKEMEEQISNLVCSVLNYQGCKEMKRRNETPVPPKLSPTILEEQIKPYQLNQDTLRRMHFFKQKGMGFLKILSEMQLASIIDQSNKEFHSNTTPTLSDTEYDIIKDYLELKYPDNAVLTQVGAPITNAKKVRLPYEMWSMDKIKPDTHALTYWITKYQGPYIISCKLDGVSGLYSTEGDIPKLYTRGNGKIGQNISHMIPYLKLPKIPNMVVRGEFIIPKNVFENKYAAKFANPRNLVAGIVNRLSVDEQIRDVHFVAYELIVPKEVNPGNQLEMLQNTGFEVVLYNTTPGISNELLSNTLVKWRKEYIYEIDGIIVTDDANYPRKTGNPEHSVAFKMVISDQIAEAIVTDVLWAPSKDGYLKPRVRIQPIKIGGITIEYATGFNAGFIEKNKIGVGAIVEIIRSGDVIPHIRRVVHSSDTPLMPIVPYKWNDTHIDIVLENIASSMEVREKNITAFFKGIGVDGLGQGNIARIMGAGFNDLSKIIGMSESDLMKIEGFKTKMASKIYNGIHDKIANVSLIKLMSASNIFGRGFDEKRIALILDEYPNILTSTETSEEKIDRVTNIKGMASKTAIAFVSKIPDFMLFLEKEGLQSKLHQPTTTHNSTNVATNHVLRGKTIVITGFRDKELLEFLQNVGGNLGSNVSKNTFAVVVKNEGDTTAKVVDALKLNIPIYTLAEFKTNNYL